MIDGNCMCSCFVNQGVRPEAFENLENQEVKEIIDGCTKTETEKR